MCSSDLKLKSATPTFPSDANYTAAASEYSCPYLRVFSTGSLSATRDLVIPITDGTIYFVSNKTTGGQAIRVIGASGTGVTISNNKSAWVICDGSNVNQMSAEI